MSRWDLYTPDSSLRTQRDANHTSSVEDGLRVYWPKALSFCVAARDVHRVERTYARAQYARRVAGRDDDRSSDPDDHGQYHVHQPATGAARGSDECCL